MKPGPRYEMYLLLTSEMCVLLYTVCVTEHESLICKHENAARNGRCGQMVASWGRKYLSDLWWVNVSAVFYVDGWSMAHGDVVLKLWRESISVTEHMLCGNGSDFHTFNMIRVYFNISGWWHGLKFLLVFLLECCFCWLDGHTTIAFLF